MVVTVTVTVTVVVELMGMLGVVLRQLQWWRVVVVVEGWCLFPCGGDWWWGLRFSWFYEEAREW